MVAGDDERRARVGAQQPDRALHQPVARPRRALEVEDVPGPDHGRGLTLPGNLDRLLQQAEQVVYIPVLARRRGPITEMQIREQKEQAHRPATFSQSMVAAQALALWHHSQEVM